ncbi:MAG: hypothetical protein ACKKMP_02515 [Candidatus Nealsonbacteria bacterium]
MKKIISKFKNIKRITKAYFFKNNPSSWDCVVDFTKINKKGISIKKLISRL